MRSMQLPGWYARFVQHLDPGERLGELLFGLIMVLTFTLGAAVELGGERQGTRELLVAALGCNAAWGIIDAALHLIGRLSERGRLNRLLRSIQTAASREQAISLVSQELEDRIPEVVMPELRAALDHHVVDRVREMQIPRNRITGPDLRAAWAVFWLVFLTALPAVLPFLVVRDPRIALRASNAVLIALLFFVGWRWAGYTGASPWRTALAMTAIGVALVIVAIALGG
jgi:hypothetical protein